MQFSETLKSLRRQANLTQEELADKLGKTRGLVAQLESGAVEPTLPNLEKLAEIFKTDIYQLISGKPEGFYSSRAMNMMNLTEVSGDFAEVVNENKALKEENKKLMYSINELQAKIIEIQEQIIKLK